MRCGAKCFLVELDANEGKQLKEVKARTPAGARRALRLEYENEQIEIISVREKR